MFILAAGWVKSYELSGRGDDFELPPGPAALVWRIEVCCARARKCRPGASTRSEPWWQAGRRVRMWARVEWGEWQWASIPRGRPYRSPCSPHTATSAANAEYHWVQPR